VTLARFVLLASVFAWSLAAAETGFIEVRGEAGSRVRVDGLLFGVTKAVGGGLVIGGIEAGERQLRFEQDGFLPQQAVVEVVAGEVVVVSVPTMQPPSGSVTVQCLPVECVVDLPSLGVQNLTKGDGELLVPGVALGVHSGTLRRRGWFARRLPVTFEICEHGDTVHLLAVMVGNEPRVTVTSALGFGVGCTPPPQRYQGRVAAGGPHSLAVLSDGTLWAWGWNAFGQLGDGSSATRTAPIPVLTDVRSVAAGWSRSFAIRNDGTLWGWGDNLSGRLGDGSLTSRFTPVRLLTDVRSVAVGLEHVLAVRDDGTLWVWGGNGSGQLGDGSLADRSVPTQVLVGVRSVSAGARHSLAVLEDGTLWAWGDNAFGQLGDGLTSNRSTPVQVLSGVEAAAAGWHHSLAVLADGSLWAWGWNAFGQLGDGSTVSRSTPVQVLDGVWTVAAGGNHSLAVQINSSLWVWGWNAFGQLGDGSTVSRSTPLQVLKGVRGVDAGFGHTLVLHEDGTVWAWGRNGKGELGDGATTAHVSPIPVMGPNLAPACAPLAVPIDGDGVASALLEPPSDGVTDGVTDGDLSEGTQAIPGVEGVVFEPIPVPTISVRLVPMPLEPAAVATLMPTEVDAIEQLEVDALEQLEVDTLGSDHAASRPVAVIVDNFGLRPISGVREAPVILEMPVEGGISRLMLLYDAALPAQIGPVRSARDYFVTVANRASAALVHVGAAPSAYSLIRSPDAPPTIDLTLGKWDPAYTRLASGAPYNVFLTDTVAVREAVDDMALIVPNPVASATVELPLEARSIGFLQTAFGGSFTSGFEYAAEDKQYGWIKNNLPVFDADGEPIRVDAVLLGEVTAMVSDDVGRLAIALDGGGPATMYLEGRALDGRWTLHHATGIGFVQENAGAVDLTPYRIWIALTPAYARRIEVP